MKRNKKLIIGAVVLALIIGVIVWNNSIAWERDFTVKYVDYFSQEPQRGGAYYLYEITNNTPRTIRNIKAVIHVINWKEFDFEDYVGSIKQGETVEYKLFLTDVKDAAKQKNIELTLAGADIVRLKY